jgi:hypothetical protein
MSEYDFPANKVANVQPQLEKLIEKNYYLNRSAKDAYRSYLLAYASQSLKHIFNVGALDLAAVAQGLGFSAPPRVNVNISATGDAVTKRGGGGGFGADSRRRMSDHADPAKRKQAIIALSRGAAASKRPVRSLGPAPAALAAALAATSMTVGPLRGPRRSRRLTSASAATLSMSSQSSAMMGVATLTATRAPR